MKKFLAPLLAAVLLLSSCNIVVDRGDESTECEDHDFKPADCTSPAVCDECGLTRGEPAGHTFGEATCTSPATCTVCGAFEGEALPHTYTETVTVSASCSSPGTLTRVCSVCSDSAEVEYVKPVYTPSEIFTVAEASVCRVNAYDSAATEYGFGTGFAISEDGQFVTNYHVIEGADSAVVVYADKRYTVKQVIAYDKDIDLAILATDAAGTVPLDICKESHATGSKIYAVGHSSGLENTFSEGIISNSLRIVEGVEHVQHSAAISSGNSGGPLLNEYAEVIGINTFMIRDAQNLNFAVSVRELDRLTKQRGMTVAEVTEKECGALIMLGSYIKRHGDYLADDGFYYISTDTVSDGGYDMFRSLICYDDGTVSFMSSVSEAESGFAAWTELRVDSTGTPYHWEYGDTTGDSLAGTLDPTVFTKSSSLTVTDSDVADASLYGDTVNIAEMLMLDCLTNLGVDLFAAGVSTDDFGFVYF